MHTRMPVLRNPAILALATLTVASAGGPGSGGGGGWGGGGRTTNPFVGTWAGSPGDPGIGPVVYTFTFTKDFRFTLVERIRDTGEMTASASCTYALGGTGPDGFPVITMFSGGVVLLQEEYSAAFEGVALRGTIFIIIARL
jgi:hypothetical protein